MSASTNQNVERKNTRTAKIITNASKLLQRIHDTDGVVSARDRAMAGVLAVTLDKRKSAS